MRPPVLDLLSEAGKLFRVNRITLSFVFGLVLLVIHSLWVRLRRRRSHRRYQQLVQQHRDRQAKRIDDFVKTYPAPQNNICEKILNCSATALTKLLASRSITAEQAVLTYCYRAIEVHNRINCLTEVLFEEALKTARKLDEMEGIVGPLHGLPISIKDCIDISGVPSSVGCSQWRNEIRKNDADIVTALRGAGAIPFCKTNVPQTMMSFECRNPLWGTTDNPHKAGFTPGGSSGGEAALVAAGGSPLGIGSDIGGSLRIPAHFSGVSALKPSYGRFPSAGSRGFRPASIILHAVDGPIARNVEDLHLVLDTCAGVASRDTFPQTKAIDLPKRLRFGVLKYDGFFKPIPSCVRAVERVEEALRGAGYEVIVDFEYPFPISDAFQLMMAVTSCDAGFFYKKALGEDPIDEALQPFFKLISLPGWTRRLLAWLTSFYKDQRSSQFLKAFGGKTGKEIMEMKAKRNEMMEKMKSKWEEAGIDVLITPGFGCPALPHGSFPFGFFAASYTYLWNIVDYPSGVVPVTTVSAECDRIQYEEVESYLNELSGSDRLFETELFNLCGSIDMTGLPIGVQVIAPQFQEPLALHAMKIVNDAIKK